MQTLIRRALLGLVTAAAVVGLSTAASANSISLQFSHTGLDTITYTNPITAASAVIIVTVQANFSNIGNGTDWVAGSLLVGSGITPTACAEGSLQTVQPGPTNSTWSPWTPNCGPGSPGQYNGLYGQWVRLMEMKKQSGISPTSGTITIGTVTFHLTGGTGLHLINVIAPMQFSSNDGYDRAPTAVGQLAVNVIPEPATVALLATGMLGLLGFSRRRKR